MKNVGFESLEQRALFAASVSVADGVLSIAGDAAADRITILAQSIVNDGDRITRYKVTTAEAGGEPSVAYFRETEVDSIEVNGGAGADKLDLLGFVPVPVQFFGGGGADTLNDATFAGRIEYSSGREVGRPSAGFTYRLEDASIPADNFGSLINNSQFIRPAMLLDGGRGNDKIFTTSKLDTIRGGAGNDVVEYVGGGGDFVEDAERPDFGEKLQIVLPGGTVSANDFAASDDGVEVLRASNTRLTLFNGRIFSVSQSVREIAL